MMRCSYVHACFVVWQEALSGSLDLTETVGNSSNEETTPKKIFSPRYIHTLNM